MESDNKHPGRPFELPAQLLDTGQRKYRRLRPVPQLPATVTIVGHAGWQLPERPLEDLSLGGLSLKLRMFEHKKVAIGNAVTLSMNLGGKRCEASGRAVHMSNRKTGWVSTWFLGIELAEDRGLDAIRPAMCEYLLRLDNLSKEPSGGAA